MGSPRDELNAILDEFVNWLPYERCISLLPAVVQTDSEIWTAKIPLIHFWIVAMHFPDRVMRQFGCFNTFHLQILLAGTSTLVFIE
jgi:hypothetical protein